MTSPCCCRSDTRESFRRNPRQAAMTRLSLVHLSAVAAILLVAGLTLGAVLAPSATHVSAVDAPQHAQTQRNLSDRIGARKGETSRVRAGIPLLAEGDNQGSEGVSDKDMRANESAVATRDAIRRKQSITVASSTTPEVSVEFGTDTAFRTPLGPRPSLAAVDPAPIVPAFTGIRSSNGQDLRSPTPGMNAPRTEHPVVRRSGVQVVELTHPSPLSTETGRHQAIYGLPVAHRKVLRVTD